VVTVEADGVIGARQFIGNRRIRRSGDPRIGTLVEGMIDRADDVVIICSFLLAAPKVIAAIERAAQRDVRAYVLTSAETSLKLDVATAAGGDDREIEKHRKALRRLARCSSMRSAVDFHAKFVIIDPRTNPAGLLSTANFRAMALETSPEAVCVLDPIDVTALFGVAQYAFWELATAHVVDEGAGSVVHSGVVPLGRAVMPALAGTAIKVLGVPGADLMEAAIGCLESAESEVRLSSYQFERGHPIVEASVRAAQRGIAVRFVVHDSPENREVAVTLTAAGVTCSFADWMHAKIVAADGTRAVVGSMNYRQHDAPRVGFEVGVELEGGAAVTAWEWLEEWMMS
jgi:cardiolipin synthase A/B